MLDDKNSKQRGFKCDIPIQYDVFLRLRNFKHNTKLKNATFHLKSIFYVEVSAFGQILDL